MKSRACVREKNRRFWSRTARKNARFGRCKGPIHPAQKNAYESHVPAEIDVRSQRPASCARARKPLKDRRLGKRKSLQLCRAGGSWGHRRCGARQSSGCRKHTLMRRWSSRREHEDGGQLSVRSRAVQPDSLRDQPHAAFDEVGREAWQLMRGAPG